MEMIIKCQLCGTNVASPNKKRKWCFDCRKLIDKYRLPRKESAWLSPEEKINYYKVQKHLSGNK